MKKIGIILALICTAALARASQIVNPTSTSGFVAVTTTNTFTAAQNFSSITFIPSTQGISGTVVGDNAAAGFVGESSRTVVALGSAVSLTGSNQYTTISSLSLAPGDWDLALVTEVSANGAAVTFSQIGIGTADGDSSSGLSQGDNMIQLFLPTSAFDASGTIPAYRVSITSTTRYYIKVFATYTVATPKGYGRLSARRVR